MTRLGVWYDVRNPARWRVPWPQLYRETLDQAAYAEELGFASIWLSEHHFSAEGYLPSLPVVMDGRVNLYGDEKFERSLNTWQGGKGWESDPDLLKAKVVIAQKDRRLTTFLRVDPNYRIVYEDKVAVVFVGLK